MKGSADLSQSALSYTGDPPKIATRCAVFAKTDLIHCQQQGYTINAICAGLCKGLALNIADALLGGLTVPEPIFVVGGVSKNRKVIEYLSDILGRLVRVPDKSVLTAAIGCAQAAKQKSMPHDISLSLSADELLRDQNQKKHYFFEPLELKYSSFPDFSAAL